MNPIINAASFEEHVQAILTRFASDYVWSDKSKSRLAIFIADALAGTTEVNQAYINFAFREAFMRRARRASSVLANARDLGQTLNRRTGSTVTATLRNNSTVNKSIPEFSAFTINGLPFYNRESVMLRPAESRKVIMGQGSIQLKSFNLGSVDLDFPEIVLGVPGHVVSMDDMLVYSENPVSGTRQVFVPYDSLFDVDADEAMYIPNTTAEGDVSLMFGNGQFGVRLNSSDRIVVRYVLTSGESGNIGSSGVRIRYEGDTTIGGITDEAAVGGSEPMDTDVLKMYAPYVFQSKRMLSRHDDWLGNIGMYPDVADVVIQGQREIAPDDLTYMNVVRVCVLPKSTSSWGGTNPNPQSGQWNKFLSWAEKLKSKHVQILPCNPERILTNIVMEVYINEDQSRESWKARTEQAIADYFRRRRGMLGRKLEISDLKDLATFGADKKRYEGLDYVRVLEPIQPIEPRSKLEYIAPNQVTVLVKYTERKGALNDI